MNSLQIFKSSDFGEIRTTIKNGEPLFIAADVCRALDIGNSRDAVGRLDGDEKDVVLTDTPGGVQQATAITESGLYALVLGSRKPEAKAFKRWITHEVIPAIRKTGGYVGNEQTFVDTYLPFADSATRALFSQTLAVIRQQNAKIDADRPKVLFADAVSTSHTSILIGDLAKILKQNGIEIGQKRLFSWLRDNDYLIKSGNSKNIPTQRAMEQGLFEIKEGSYVDGNGCNITTKTSKVTGKGQMYFVNKFLATERG